MEVDFVKKIATNLLKQFPCLGTARRDALITMVDDDIYNMGSPTEKIDLSKERIVRYDNVTKYYDPSTARFKLVTPSEEPRIKEATVLLETDDDVDEVNYFQYATGEGFTDVTAEFIAEVKGRQYTKK